MQYSASRERVLDVLADGKPLSTLEASKKTGLTRSQVGNALMLAWRRGLVLRTTETRFVSLPVRSQSTRHSTSASVKMYVRILNPRKNGYYYSSSISFHAASASSPAGSCHPPRVFLPRLRRGLMPSRRCPRTRPGSTGA